MSAPSGVPSLHWISVERVLTEIARIRQEKTDLEAAVDPLLLQIEVLKEQLEKQKASYEQMLAIETKQCVELIEEQRHQNENKCREYMEIIAGLQGTLDKNEDVHVLRDVQYIPRDAEVSVEVEGLRTRNNILEQRIDMCKAEFATMRAAYQKEIETLKKHLAKKIDDGA